jgi:hypothetical protein
MTDGQGTGRDRMTTTLTLAWDGADIAELFGLDALPPGHFRSRLGQPNENGRVYGGQMPGQTLAVTAGAVPEGKLATTMQFVFRRRAASPRLARREGLLSIRSLYRGTDIDVSFRARREATVGIVQVACLSFVGCAVQQKG